jgi:hypothetical protein
MIAVGKLRLTRFQMENRICPRSGWGQAFPENALHGVDAFSNGKPGSTFPENALYGIVAASDGKPGPSAIEPGQASS